MSHSCRSQQRSLRLRAWAIAIPAMVATALLFAGGPVVTDDGAPVEGAPPGGGVAPAQTASMRGAAAAEATIGAATSRETTEPDEAIWVEGELVPPLPKDPARRRAAIDQARANSAANARVPDVTYHPVVASEPTMPVFSSDFASRTASTRRPMAGGPTRTEPDWPDDFELPADVLRELSKEGTIDKATEAEMEGILAQSLIQDFHGIDQTSYIPASPDIAVSRDYVVLVVNSTFAVYNKCGTQLHEASLATLTEAGPNIGSPKVVYDEWDDRWILSFAAYDVDPDEAWVCLCVSATSTPMGVGASWTYSYVWTNNGGYRGDSADLGCDPDAVYLATNDYEWGVGFQRSRIASLDKAEVYAGAGSFRDEFFAMTNPGDGTLAFGIQAAEMNSDPGKYLLVNSKRYGGSILTLWEITGTVDAPVLNGYNIAVGAYDDPPNLMQGNATYVECGDAKLHGAKYYVGRLWTAQVQRVNWGETDDRSAVEIYLIDTTTRLLSQETGPLGAMGYYYSYPAVDFDPSDRGILVFSRGGPAENLSIRYTDFTEGGSFGTSSLLRAGYAYYAEGNHAGTNADPFFWGNFFGCDIERDGDNRTMWFYGQFASDSPSPSWDTWVGAASFETAPALSVTPVNSGANPFNVTGYMGGPFYPSGVTYTLENTGGSAVTWTLSGLAAWNTASATSGQINPGATTNVTITVNAVANGYVAGTYNDSYTFSNCLSGVTAVRATRLTIANYGMCPGAVSELYPSTTPEFGGVSDNQERGSYVTALQDFEVCAIGFRADLALPQQITARIYSASGTTRGPLLAAWTTTAVEPGSAFHFVPISYTLESCQEYDIAVEWGTANSWDYWDDRLYRPLDVNGVIRVRSGEYAGDASNIALVPIVVVGSSVESPETADLDPDQGTGTSSGTSDDSERGVYIKSEETIRINSFGWEANLVAPQTLIARVYEATGTTRGAMIAEGTLEVTSSGLRFHDVPLNCVLEEGKEYDLAITFGVTNSWPWWNENDLDEPYSVGPIRVVTSELGGTASNFALPHYRVSGGPGAAGVSFDLAKMNGGYPPTNSSSQDNSSYGAYVRSVVNQELYSLGWMANVPEGEAIITRVYAATGTTRGALLSEGTVHSPSGGMKWHDIPVSVSLSAATDYDFSITWVQCTEWRWWNDQVPAGSLPYDSYGVLRVVNSEFNGSAANSALIHMRMNACNAAATAIGDTPVQPPKFALAQPYPNPLSTSATIPFELDEAGPVRITVYDVLGRRVATLLENEKRPAGPSQVQFNAERLAAGIYFVKLEANQKSVTRKIAIVR
jgi:hypothetical protein